jgi:hypothetical protein
MTYYSTFDSKIHCEESATVSPEEMAEVFQMLGEEHAAEQSFAEWSAEQESNEPEEVKDWLGGYSNSTDGPSYNGCDV